MGGSLGYQNPCRGRKRKIRRIGGRATAGGLVTGRGSRSGFPSSAGSVPQGRFTARSSVDHVSQENPLRFLIKSAAVRHPISRDFHSPCHHRHPHAQRHAATRAASWFPVVRRSGWRNRRPISTTVVGLRAPHARRRLAGCTRRGAGNVPAVVPRGSTKNRISSRSLALFRVP